MKRGAVKRVSGVARATKRATGRPSSVDEHQRRSFAHCANACTSNEPVRFRMTQGISVLNACSLPLT